MRRKLTIEDRIEIEIGLRCGETDQEIGYRLGRDRSVIYRERRRNANKGGDYRAQTADGHSAHRRRRPQVRKLDRDGVLRARVLHDLQSSRTPRQIAGRLRLEARDGTVAPMENTPNRSGTCVSHEAIYRWIYAHPAKTLREQGILLRSRRTTRQRRPPPGERQRGSRLIGMVSIDARPAEVLSRRVPGAWEGDLIMGRMNQTAVATLVERSSRFVILIALPQGKNAEGLADAVIDKVRTLPALMRQSLTWDQGTEMAEHARITLATELPIYFAHPHSPWERPSNENTNGLIREYLPKGTDIDVSQSYLNRIANELNNRPRQTLGFYTPKEVFNRFIKENAERDQCACTG